MNYVEQLPSPRWGGDITVKREGDRLLIGGTWLWDDSRETKEADDVWRGYLAQPRDWSPDRRDRTPHIEFANATSADDLVEFVQQFGPVVACSYLEKEKNGRIQLSACQDLAELRNEQILYSAALRLLALSKGVDEPNREQLLGCVREIAARVAAWPGQWERESRLGASQSKKPEWEFTKLDLENLQVRASRVERVISGKPVTPEETRQHQIDELFNNPIREAQIILCDLINAFHWKVQPANSGKVVEWPSSDLSFGVRPLLYLILRRAWLVGSIGICANERCRRLFEVDRMPYCSTECSRSQRQRQYWSAKGSLQRRKRRKRQKSKIAKQKNAPQRKGDAGA